MDRMKVHIEKFGAVTIGGDIEIKPLTIFIGPNNSGKTWSAYLISAILGWPGGNYYTTEYINNRVTKRYEIVDNVVNDVIKKGNASINLLDFYNLYYSEFINDVAKNSKIWFNKFMATSKAINTHEVFFSFNEPLDEYIERLKQLRVEDSVGVGDSDNEDKDGLLNVKKEYNDQVMYFYTTEADIKEKLPLLTIKNFIVGNIFRAIQRSFFKYVRYFPSERTGIVAIETAKTSFRKKDEMRTLEQEVNRTVAEESGRRVFLPVPMRSMVNFINRIKKSENRKFCDKCDDKSCYIRDDRVQYSKLSVILEDKIISGNLAFTEPGPDGISEYLYKHKGSIDLDIPSTSSSIKDLMVLALYLRFASRRDELLIIDEPEMNLHPTAQAQFAELLGMMVNAGLKVVITTQSTYIVDHLNNLLKASKISNEENIKDIEDLFFLKDRRAFIPQDMVSAYLFDENRIMPILKKNGRIEWKTFSRVSEKLFSISNDLVNM